MKKHLYDSAFDIGVGVKSQRVTFCGRKYNVNTTNMELESDKSFIINKHKRDMKRFCETCLRGVGVKIEKER